MEKNIITEIFYFDYYIKMTLLIVIIFKTFEPLLITIFFEKSIFYPFLIIYIKKVVAIEIKNLFINRYKIVDYYIYRVGKAETFIIYLYL